MSKLSVLFVKTLALPILVKRETLFQVENICIVNKLELYCFGE